ncbi:hypothetical protein FRB98_007484 [Tulasnella sp. 332]|nr:hypothetical protein FRB98_007484 [Tulasnella sp. 332]
MSGTSAPVSEHSPTGSAAPRSRTLAIITSQGLPHRFDIESRIYSSGFEVIKERQIGFHAHDPSVQELFGEEAGSVCGEPVRELRIVMYTSVVYVLERRRAVEVWHTVMGDKDPEIARVDAPESLRALYGKTIYNNAVYGSPNEPMAELQINSIFASSPPFPPIDLPNDIPAALAIALPESEASASSSSDALSHTNESPTLRVDVKSKTKGFKALPLPATTAFPSIQPRSSRASALRAGVQVSPVKRVLATKESLAKTFENVPGHKRASLSIVVASTAPPAIAPRQNRALELRKNGENKDGRGLRRPPTVARKPTTPERTMQIFENTPGHKRRETISVASTAPPVIAPRPTKASVLRTGVEITSAPNPATMPKVKEDRPLRGRMSFDNVPGHKRNITIDVPSVRTPSTPPRINRSALLRIAHKEGGSASAGPPSSFFMKPIVPQRPLSLSRANSQASLRAAPPVIVRAQSQSSVRLAPPSTSTVSSSARSASVGRPAAAAASTPASSPRTPAAAPRHPSIQPRTNRASLLRAKLGTPNPATRRVFAF